MIAFCIEHGDFHDTEVADPTCDMEDGMGNPVTIDGNMGQEAGGK